MIHSSRSTAAVRERGYPKLRIRKYDGSIVLFTSSTTGTLILDGCLSATSATPSPLLGLGYHTNNWTYGEFKDYEGSVVLEND